RQADQRCGTRIRGRVGMSRKPRGVWFTLLLVWLVIYPLAWVILDAVRDRGGWTVSHVVTFAGTPEEWQALWGGVGISVAGVVFSGAIGIPLAFVFERLDFPGRRVLGGLVALPAVLPPLVGVIAFLFLYGESGFAARIIKLVFGLEDSPWRLNGPVAILLVHAYSMYVYFYLFTRAGLARVDSSMLQPAQSLGSAPL